MLKVKNKVLSALALSTALLTGNASALKIELNQVTPSNFTGANGLAALAGFQAAANFWEKAFSDKVTLKFDIDFAALNPGVVGSTGSNTGLYLYQNAFVGLINDAKSNGDVSAVNNLTCENQGVGVCAFSFLDEEPDGLGGLQTVLDSDGSVDNYAISINTATAKALGFSEDDTGYVFGDDADASITFSSEFAFDFDRTDGIDFDKFDFIGVAIHEIGHALGFTSGVDTYDFINHNRNPDGSFDLDGFVVADILDLFRFSDESVAAGAGVLDFRPGADAFFSIDGGATAIAPFSTGRFGGDGQQASHWKDNLGLGILDPTVAFGELLQVSVLDLVAFDVIGWDIRVPAPSTLLMFMLAAAGVAYRRKQA
ncbi:MAG: PEP-CTERM sorting domain-containing protein [Paraglaciecola sp.]|nr:PEP-CTERM sorting domain-containing protein [Paraglaciecola sp.]NCT49147.1 PEP-CTERM sorting domain-containing protein [Paraglaciecola sp.]